MNIGVRISEVKATRSNVFVHQPVWLSSRLSCPPESPACAIEESLAQDNLTAYALGRLRLVYNHTALSDVCNPPSFGTSHGFLDRPDVFNIVHDLFPNFSQSKMSSFQDILYPSPWYWASKVDYKERKELDWKAKIDALLWKGVTAGGFSRNGEWRRQHRRLMVRRLNAVDNALILEDTNKDSLAAPKERTPSYKTKEVPRQESKNAMDVHFSHIGQYDPPGDCDAQKEFFEFDEGVGMQEH